MYIYIYIYIYILKKSRIKIIIIHPLIQVVVHFEALGIYTGKHTLSFWVNLYVYAYTRTRLCTAHAYNTTEPINIYLCMHIVMYKYTTNAILGADSSGSRWVFVQSKDDVAARSTNSWILLQYSHGSMLQCVAACLRRYHLYYQLFDISAIQLAGLESLNKYLQKQAATHRITLQHTAMAWGLSNSSPQKFWFPLLPLTSLWYDGQVK